MIPTRVLRPSGPKPVTNMRAKTRIIDENIPFEVDVSFEDIWRKLYTIGCESRRGIRKKNQQQRSPTRIYYTLPFWHLKIFSV